MLIAQPLSSRDIIMSTRESLGRIPHDLYEEIVRHPIEQLSATTHLSLVPIHSVGNLSIAETKPLNGTAENGKTNGHVVHASVDDGITHMISKQKKRQQHVDYIGEASSASSDRAASSHRSKSAGRIRSSESSRTNSPAKNKVAAVSATPVILKTEIQNV